MISFTENLFRSAAERLNLQEKLLHPNQAQSHHVNQHTDPAMMRSSVQQKTQMRQQAQSERAKFMIGRGRSQAHPEPLVTHPPRKPNLTSVFKNDQGSGIQPSISHENTHFDQRRLNLLIIAEAKNKPTTKLQQTPALLRADSNDPYPKATTSSTPLSANSRISSLEQRLDKLNGRPTGEDGKPLSLDQWQSSLEERLDKLKGRPTGEDGKPMSLDQWQSSLEQRLKALTKK